jgi:quercetin dioxygenase-like cupin family protein
MGKSISMRLWEEGPFEKKAPVSRDYETVGFVLEGRAELEIEGQTIELKTGDSWVVPKGSKHSYAVKEHFRAVEATHPPAEVHDRDAKS